MGVANAKSGGLPCPPDPSSQPVVKPAGQVFSLSCFQFTADAAEPVPVPLEFRQDAGCKCGVKGNHYLRYADHGKDAQKPGGRHVGTGEPPVPYLQLESKKGIDNPGISAFSSSQGYLPVRHRRHSFRIVRDETVNQ